MSMPADGCPAPSCPAPPALARRRPGCNPWILTAAILWIVLVVACAVKAAYRPQRNSVFPIYTFAAGEWFAGRNIYVEMRGYDWWRYSPLAAILFEPLRWLGDSWGGALWRCLSAEVLAWGLWSWARFAIPLPLSPQRLGLLFILVWPFLLQNANNGQANTLIAGCLLLGAANAARGRLWRAAIWFVGGGLFKPYVLAVAMLSALILPRLWGRLALVTAAGTALPYLFQSAHYVNSQYVGWFYHFANSERTPLELRNAYRDFSLLFRMYFSPLSPMAVHTISALVGLAMAVYVWVKRRHGSTNEQLFRAFALGCCWITVFGPATESCTYIFLAPVLAAAVVTSPGAAGRWVRASYALFPAVVCAGFFPEPWKVQIWGPQPLAGLLFLGIIWFSRDPFSAGRRAPTLATISP